MNNEGLWHSGAVCPCPQLFKISDIHNWQVSWGEGGRRASILGVSLLEEITVVSAFQMLDSKLEALRLISCPSEVGTITMPIGQMGTLSSER